MFRFFSLSPPPPPSPKKTCISKQYNRPTHLFGGGGNGTTSTATTNNFATSRNSQSPPQSSIMRRGLGNNNSVDDDGGLADFLGPSGTNPPSSSAGQAGMGDADRYGLFTTNTGNTRGVPRVSQSRARYDTLFGEEVIIRCFVESLMLFPKTLAVSKQHKQR